MSKPIVRCRCGHQVVGREVLRTEPYERSSGEEVVYVKYRCRHCKRIGEQFIPRLEWDPAIFDAPRDEMSYDERDRFLDESAVSSADLISFHRALQKMQTIDDLQRPTSARKNSKDSKNRAKDGDKPSQTGRTGN